MMHYSSSRSGERNALRDACQGLECTEDGMFVTEICHADLRPHTSRRYGRRGATALQFGFALEHTHVLMSVKVCAKPDSMLHVECVTTCTCANTHRSRVQTKCSAGPQVGKCILHRCPPCHLELCAQLRAAVEIHKP